MKIEITRQDGSMLLYALQLLLDKQWEEGYPENKITPIKELSQLIYDATQSD